jgi:hypothetical protein
VSDEPIGEIVGQIRPGFDGGAPLFKIIRRRDVLTGYGSEGNENVRPCDHASFILDEKFATVTCGECKTQVDAFSVLMWYAEWGEKWKMHRLMSERAEKDVYVALLRQMSKRVALTDDERKEVKTAIRDSYRIPINDLKILERKISNVLSNRRYDKRKARRSIA